MGRQSSRIYYQGKDHKDIYFQGHYHDAMYVGDRLVWEKLDGKIEPLLYEDVSSAVSEDRKKQQIQFMVSSAFGSVVFYTPIRDEYTKNGSGYLFRYMPTNELTHISGKNVALINDEMNTDALFPDDGLYVPHARVMEGSGRYKFVYAFTNLLYWKEKFRSTQPSYLVDTMQMINMQDGSVVEGIQFYIDGAPVERNSDANACYIDIGSNFSQYFAGEIHADVKAGVGYQSRGICSSTDGINWTTGSKITGTGTIIGGILFYDNGIAINSKYEAVGYTRMPAIYVNGWYYAEEFEEGYLMRSKNLTNWERYKNIGAGEEYKVSGYWRTKNLLCLRKEINAETGDGGIYKYKIHL